MRSATAGCGPMPRMKLLAACSLAALLCGCSAVGPDYVQPKTDLKSFQNVEAASSATASSHSISLDDWWTGFNDPVLTSIVDRALAQNLDLSASIARVAQARAAAREAGARLLPSAALETQADAMHESLNSPIGQLAGGEPGYYRNATDYSAGVEASWEIDLAGGLRRGAEAAGDEAQAAGADHLGVRVSVAADAADAYLQIRGYQARLAFAAKQIETDEHLLELVKMRRTSGATTDREVAQVQALVMQARATVPPLNAGLAAQLNRLDVLMGRQPGTYDDELRRPAAIPPPPAIPPSLSPAQMLRRRPDVIAAERRLAASNADIGVAVSEYYPKVSIAGLLGVESLNDGVNVRGLFSAASFQPQAIAGLKWRLFDFGRVDAEVVQAKSANAASLASYRQSVLKAAEDVEDALSDLVQLDSQEEEIGDEITALSRVRETSQEAYAAGAISLTDVLDADRQLLAAQDDAAKIQADTSRAAVALFRAMGGGWTINDQLQSGRNAVASD
jgi:NodT family efflux transporter outer membrane factor (OMF) lipoprotein